MIEEKSLELNEAEEIINELIAQITETNKVEGTDSRIAIAVVGRSGNLIALKTMDGTKEASPLIAWAKAYTAAKVQTDTNALAENGRDSRDFIDPMITCLPGGVAISNNFQPDKLLIGKKSVIGGIGISGLAPSEDNAMANLGRNLFLHFQQKGSYPP